MPVIKVPTTFNIDLEFEIAEFHRRFFAWIIDVIVQIIYLRIAFKVASLFISDQTNLSEDGQYNIWGIQNLIMVPVFLYYLICESTMNGQTIGKKIVGIRVVDEYGGRAGISQYIIRWLIRTGDLMIIVLIFILMFFPFALTNSEVIFFMLASLVVMIVDIVLVVSSKKSQRIGDILAHTILVRTKAKGSMEETVFMEVADNYVPVFPQIMRLTDKDINAIKSIMDMAQRRGDFTLAVTACEKIKSHLKIDTDMAPVDFLQTLLKDYNYLSVK